MDGCNIRRRGSCSSSPSLSFKRAVMAGKTRVKSGSRCSTPVPTWRMTTTSNVGAVVSARKLAATLWEVNSLVSDRVDRSRTRPRLRTLISHRRQIVSKDGEALDSHSNTSLMKIKTKPRAQTPNRIVNDVKPRLKEVSKALTTSKELLKVIHRMWTNDNLPSSSVSLISALQGELEQACHQVNNIIKDQDVDHTEVNHLLKSFAEERALWERKERLAIDTAIESISSKLEVEKKLRRRSERLNKKLGRELTETHGLFARVLKELESEKRAREIMQQVCDDLTFDIGKDRDEEEEKELERESIKVHEEVKKKNRLVDKLRSQLETVLGKKVKRGRKDEEPMAYLRKHELSGTCLNEEDDDREVEDDKDLVDDKIIWRSSDKHLVNEKALRRSGCLITRSISDGNEWGIQETFSELETQIAHGDDLQRYKSVKGLRDRILTNLKSRDFDDSGHTSWS